MWNRHPPLTVARARQRAEGDLRHHRSCVEPMPSISTEAGQNNVRDERAYPEGLTRKIDRERASHRTAATVSPYQIPGTNRMGALGRTDARCHARVVLL